jgi:phage-related protein
MSKQWIVRFYSTEVKNEVAKLPIGLLAKYVRLTTLMEIYGPNIGMPHTKSLGKGLIEMRLKAVEGIARVFYATFINREIVILHSIIKKTNKIPKKDLEVAYIRLQEIKK